ncbi:MAG: alpha-L-fucosidase [Opitutaceae bacterium]|nr:alpha-L-fucosidase [Opitutaceae bacterium]
MNRIPRIPAVSRFARIAGFAILVAVLPAPAEGASDVRSREGSPSFRPDWESLQQYRCPDWFRDAKFGIYTHWGVYSVPQFSTEWYSHHMYQPNHRAYAFHRKNFGPLDQFGYKDFIPRFTAEKFNADEWAELFRRAGAKFAGPVAEHADGFAMWDSPLTTWDAKDMGPKRDVVGELETAIRKRGLKFVASLHHSWLWGWYATADKNADIHDPRYAGFYGPDLPVSAFSKNPNPPPDETFCDRWLAKTKEVINRYHPDLLYFDTKLYTIAERFRLEMISHYYNQAAQREQAVVLTYKQEDLKPGAAVLDMERGRMASIQSAPWMTDTSVARNSWGYVENLEYYPTRRLVHDLVDIVSKNGCLLLNVAPRADGTIPEEQRERLLGIGRWLELNGEAIYGTRPWRVFGEGPTKVEGGMFGDLKLKDFTADDIRFTSKGDTVYAILLGWSDTKRTLGIRALGRANVPGNIRSVELLGRTGPLEFTRTNDELQITLPETPPGEHAWVFRIVHRAPP